ncbi:MAG TPA: class I SAM-dependent methyltransferase [Rhodothermia bacterium]
MRTSSQSERPAGGHWQGIARLWSQVGPPLRPSLEDLRFVEQAVNRKNDRTDPFRVLILGVTPELYELPWPDETEVVSADHTAAMIDEIWPGPPGTAHLTEWTSLPFATDSHHIVLCDGGLHLVKYPDGSRQLAQEVRRILLPGGLCILRLFLPPRKRESVDSVLTDLLAGGIGNLNLLKFRLWMALHEDPAEGVELRKVWDAVHSAAPDLERLATNIGWSPDHMLAINTYRGSQNRYHFLDMNDVTKLFCEDRGGFEVESVHVPTYELGEQCPTLVLRRATEGPPR